MKNIKHHWPRQQLIVFLKPPIAGCCKTRLIPLLGEYSATRLYRQMVLHCMDQLDRLDQISIKLCLYADNESAYLHPFIIQLQNHYGFEISLQRGGDLGERMHNAITESLQDHDQCVLIGTDCPEINSTYIQSAFQQLEQHSLVIGPACDGGYVLIGANQPVPEIFIQVDWSTEHVLQQTLDKAQACDYHYQLLSTLWDVDTPEDYIQHYQRIQQLLKPYTFISEPRMRLYHEPEAS